MKRFSVSLFALTALLAAILAWIGPPEEGTAQTSASTSDILDLPVSR